MEYIIRVIVVYLNSKIICRGWCGYVYIFKCFCDNKFVMYSLIYNLMM